MPEQWKDKTMVVIAGPTAVGKTAVAIRLAQHYHTDIISADSRQFFRELNIGTAKPSPEELQSVHHHFINSHSISEEYDAAQYGADALQRIYEIFQRHNTVIVCGGSGLYIKALLEGFDDIPEVSTSVREKLIDGYEKYGIPWLQSQMIKMDPDHYAVVDQNNPHRLIRALEVRIGTGQSISSFQKKKRMEHPFTITKIGLELDRNELYERIDRRMEAMLAKGLFEEARSLYASRNHNALQTVGYQEIFPCLEGVYDDEEAIRLLKRNSRRYAKRQLTWFKRDREIRWFHPDDWQSIVSYIDTFRSN